MKKREHGEFFWLSYSDLMTSLFFVALVLFVVCYVVARSSDTSTLLADNEKLRLQLDEVNKDLERAEVTIQQSEAIKKINKQFRSLSQLQGFAYDEKKKTFYSISLEGKELFAPYEDKVLPEQRELAIKAGQNLEEMLKKLNKDGRQAYVLVIEGMAAAPHGSSNKDAQGAYELSYKRALSLYNLWRSSGISIRKYNTEIIIGGSGFNGINRDEIKEENNKRFILQLLPKFARIEE